MRIVYSFFLLIWAAFMAVKLLFQGKGGKLLSRLRLPKIPPKGEKERRIWIHSVSLGETKAAAPLIKQIKEELPDAKIYLSTLTVTGLQEAKKSEFLEACFLLPLDLPYLMKKLVKSVSPDLFIFIETDFWPGLLHELKAHGTKIALINGKMSEKSFKRFQLLHPLTKRLFGGIDLFCLQSEEYRKRFSALPINNEKIVVTGNVKFDIIPQLKRYDDLHFPKRKKIVTIASTHEGEEELILNALGELGDDVCLLFAPRHPERFERVAAMLKGKGKAFRLIGEPSDGKEEIVLINRMGVMDHCFANSHAAIVGGSFITGVGGHNIFEPARHGLPVFYGPNMHTQKELVLAFERHNVAGEVTLEGLKPALLQVIHGPINSQGYENLRAEMEGATNRSWKLIKML